MRKNIETGDKTRKKRDLVVSENLPFGHKRHWTDWIRHQTASIGPGTVWHFDHH
jgi:hypothetical protein